MRTLFIVFFIGLLFISCEDSGVKRFIVNDNESNFTDENSDADSSDSGNTATDQEITDTGTDTSDTGTDLSDTGSDENTDTGTDLSNTGSDENTDTGTDLSNTGSDENTDTGTDLSNTGTDENADTSDTGTDLSNTGTDEDTDADSDTDTATQCGSIQLDGSSGYIEVAYNALLDLSSEWTIEAWVKQSSDSSQQAIVRKGGSDTSYPPYYLYGKQANYSTPYGGFYYQNGWNYAYDSAGATTSPEMNVWYHVAFVRTSSKIMLFFNGKLEKETNSDHTPITDSSNLFFGTRQTSSWGGQSTYFSGYIDEIRISSKALYSSDFTPKTRFTTDSDTVGVWHFEEKSGTTAADSSDNGLNGTLNGGATWASGQCAGE